MRKVTGFRLRVPLLVLPWRPVRALLCGVSVCLWFSSASGAAVDRRYCLSEICPGDPPAVVGKLVLTDLSRIAERGRHKVDLAIALPDISPPDRKILESRKAADGRYLVDHLTIGAFLGIKTVCAPIEPFVALFSSESGHTTAIEFDMVNVGGRIEFAVKSISRKFDIKVGTPAGAALIADLTNKFGFAIDGGGAPQLADGLTVAFRTEPESMTLSIALPALESPVAQIASQMACAPKDRMHVD